MSRAPIHIIADHREARAGVVDALDATKGIQVEFGHLTVGDYEVEGTFVFERKRLPDLAISIQDGRLFRQARRLAGLTPPKRGAFILEGTSADLADSAMRREAIQGALVTIALFFGVPVLRARNAEKTARVMVYAARQARWFTHGALPRHAKRPKGKRRAQSALLQGLPGVGPDRAARLLERFGSVEAILTAAQEELTAVQGIGTDTAKKIRWIVSEPDAPSYDA